MNIVRLGFKIKKNFFFEISFEIFKKTLLEMRIIKKFIYLDIKIERVRNKLRLLNTAEVSRSFSVLNVCSMFIYRTFAKISF